MGQIGKGLDYVKSIPCILKIVEIIVLLIAFSLAGHFLNETTDGFFSYYGKKGNIEFFLFVTIVGWLISIAFLIIFVIGIHEKISVLPWPLVVAIVSAFWTVLLLISSALLAAAAKHYDDEKYPLSSKSACEILDDLNSDPQCGQIVGGTVLGFIAMVLYAVDTAIHVHMVLKAGVSTGPQAASEGIPA